MSLSVRPLLGAAVAVGLALCGCGETTAAQPGWVANHPSTTLITFDTTAPGVCAITVRYPDDAPAAINYLGSVYVQVAQLPHATLAPAARAIDHSGDWQVSQQNGGDLMLLTPTSTYDYRLELASHC